MNQKDIWDIVLNAISIIVTLSAVIVALIQSRKDSLRRLKIIEIKYDNEMKTKLFSKIIRISLTNTGNRNIEIKSSKIKISKGNYETIPLLSVPFDLGIDRTHEIEINKYEIKSFLSGLNKKIDPNTKLEITFYDSTNKKYKIKFKYKLSNLMK